MEEGGGGAWSVTWRSFWRARGWRRTSSSGRVSGKRPHEFQGVKCIENDHEKGKRSGQMVIKMEGRRDRMIEGEIKRWKNGKDGGKEIRDDGGRERPGMIEREK